MSYNGYKNKETWEVIRCINNSEQLFKLAKTHKCYKDFAYDAIMLFGGATESGIMWHDALIDHDQVNNNHVFNEVT